LIASSRRSRRADRDERADDAVRHQARRDGDEDVAARPTPTETGRREQDGERPRAAAVKSARLTAPARTDASTRPATSAAPESAAGRGSRRRRLLRRDLSR
jgi:hypothetical protein